MWYEKKPSCRRLWLFCCPSVAVNMRSCGIMRLTSFVKTLVASNRMLWRQRAGEGHPGPSSCVLMVCNWRVSSSATTSDSTFSSGKGDLLQPNYLAVPLGCCFCAIATGAALWDVEAPYRCPVPGLLFSIERPAANPRQSRSTELFQSRGSHHVHTGNYCVHDTGQRIINFFKI